MTKPSERREPRLPQHESPSGQRHRGIAVAEARGRVGWTTDVATLPGVPLATKVPKGDKPSVPWLIEAVRVGLPVVENAIADLVGAAEAKALEDELAEIRESVAHIEERHGAAIEPSAAVAEEGAFQGAVDVVVGKLEELLGRHEDRLWKHLGRLQELHAKHLRAPDPASTLEDYASLYRKLPAPPIVQTFQEDATFARLRVAGPNPMRLVRARTLPDALPEAVRGPEGPLMAALGAGRLFVVDYAEVGAIVAGEKDGKQAWLMAPIAWFEVPEGAGSLRPVGILLGREAGAPWVTPPADGTVDAAWEMAKYAVQVADGNDHELFAHLARTHLVVEAFAVATRRNLAPQHPVALLLEVHLQGTLFINNSAAGSLISTGGAIDKIFGGTIDTTQLAAARDRLAVPMDELDPPSNVAARGVGPDSALQDFPWRDDGTLVWEAISTWVGEYLAVYYASDREVVGDIELAAWSAELAGVGDLTGFEVPRTVAALQTLLARVIYTGSAQHAAVNFPQRDLMSYAPNVSGSAWASPTVDAPSEETWLAMMPPLHLAGLQLGVLAFLGGLYFGSLGAYKSPDFPYDGWFLDPKIIGPDGPLDRFRVALREVEAEVERRNEQRAVPYTYLLPSKIPQSINI